MTTWTQVADQVKVELQQDVMKQAWEEAKEEVKVENWDDHYDFQDEFTPYTEGDFEVPSIVQNS